MGFKKLLDKLRGAHGKDGWKWHEVTLTIGGRPLAEVIGELGSWGREPLSEMERAAIAAFRPSLGYSPSGGDGAGGKEDGALPNGHAHQGAFGGCPYLDAPRQAHRDIVCDSKAECPEQCFTTGVCRGGTRG